MISKDRLVVYWNAFLPGILIGILVWCFVSFWFSLAVEPLRLALGLALYIALPTTGIAIYCHYVASRQQARYTLYLLNAWLTILSIAVVSGVTYHKLIGTLAGFRLTPVVTWFSLLSTQAPLGLIFGALGYAVALTVALLVKQLQQSRRI